MRHLVYLVLILTSIAIGIPLGGCGRSDGGAQYSMPEIREDGANGSDETSSDSTQIVKEVKQLKEQLSELSEKLEKQEDNVNEMTSSLSDVRSTNKWLWIGMGCMGVILIILILVVRNIVSQQSKRIKDIEYKLGTKRGENDEVRGFGVQSGATRANNTSASDLAYLIGDVNTLKSQVSQLSMQIMSSGSGNYRHTKTGEGFPNGHADKSAEVTVKEKAKRTPKVKVYFGVPVGGEIAYFKKEFRTMDQDARFSAEIEEDKATFRPLNELKYIRAVKSIDEMRLAIDIQGEIPSSPESMQILESGVAVKKNGKWEIEKKAIVKLS